MSDAEVAEVLRENVALKAELSFLRRFLPEHVDGAPDHQATAWQMVFRQCLALGMDSFRGPTGAERVASFIRDLASRAERQHFPRGADVPSR